MPSSPLNSTDPFPPETRSDSGGVPAVITTEPPNLLLQLFDWRPREDITPAENFLTEAFVYNLRMNEIFRTKWLQTILEEGFLAGELDITTRASHTDDDRQTTIFPDIEIRGKLISGENFSLLVEVKWGAKYSSAQLSKYDRLLRNKPNPHLAFITASWADFLVVQRQSALLGAKLRVFRWEQIYSLLENCLNECRPSEELLAFMRHYGLSPGEPISSNMLMSYLASKSFLRRLDRYCEKLLHEFEWDFLPAAYNTAPEIAYVSSAFGRTAIVFSQSGWDGTITIGFLHSNSDHKVPFCDGSNNSVDLMLRIEAGPKAESRSDVIGIIEKKATAVRSAGGVIHLANDKSNGNGHTLFIGLKSLEAFLIEAQEIDQLTAMHNQIKAWSKALFQDGELGEALKLFDQKQNHIDGAPG